MLNLKLKYMTVHEGTMFYYYYSDVISDVI